MPIPWGFGVADHERADEGRALHLLLRHQVMAISSVTTNTHTAKASHKPLAALTTMPNAKNATTT